MSGIKLSDALETLDVFKERFKSAVQEFQSKTGVKDLDIDHNNYYASFMSEMWIDKTYFASDWKVKKYVSDRSQVAFVHSPVWCEAVTKLLKQNIEQGNLTDDCGEFFENISNFDNSLDLGNFLIETILPLISELSSFLAENNLYRYLGVEQVLGLSSEFYESSSCW